MVGSFFYFIHFSSILQGEILQQFGQINKNFFLLDILTQLTGCILFHLFLYKNNSEEGGFLLISVENWEIVVVSEWMDG